MEKKQKPYIDLAGQQFGKLTVIEYVGNSKWMCSCSCGLDKVVDGKSLRGGLTKSCGCLRKESNRTILDPNLIGAKFGKWTLLDFPEQQIPYTPAKAICKCDCGKDGLVSISSLKSGASLSCGCYVSEKEKEANKKHALPPGEYAFRRLFKNYKGRAIKNNREFELSTEEFIYLVKSNCYYCGNPPIQEIRGKEGKTPFVYNGIDRVDNRKGYTLFNCVTCCGDCNAFKKHISFEFIKKIYDHPTFKCYLGFAEE